MAVVAHPGVGMTSVAARGVATEFRIANNCRGGGSDSSRAVVSQARAVSGRYCSCSSSTALSQSRKSVVVMAARTRRRAGAGASTAATRCSAVEDGVSGRASFVQPTKDLQFFNADESSAATSRAQKIRALADDSEVPVQELITEELLSSLSSLADLDTARSQPAVQGFGENTFDGFMEVVSTAVGGSLNSEVLATAGTLYRPKWVWFAKSVEEENVLIERAINATIIGSAGALALTKMLTVDHDYWHGWTAFEILMYAPIHNWFAYEDLLQTHPVLAKMAISGTVYTLGDWIAQCYEGKGPLEFNRTRMLRSGLVGFCLHGSLSHFYYHFCEWLFPFQGWWVVPLKVGFDQTIWSGFWNSIYFIMVGLLRFESPARILKELRETFIPLLTAGWKLWPFAHLITYGLIPVEQRLLWVDMVEIIWVTILAMYSNEKSEARLAEAESNEALKDASMTAVPVEELVSSSADKLTPSS